MSAPSSELNYRPTLSVLIFLFVFVCLVLLCSWEREDLRNRIMFWTFLFSESDPPHMIMRYWFYYSIRLGFSAAAMAQKHG